jgi:hypothetical protein
MGKKKSVPGPSQAELDAARKKQEAEAAAAEKRSLYASRKGASDVDARGRDVLGRRGRMAMRKDQFRMTNTGVGAGVSIRGRS